MRVSHFFVSMVFVSSAWAQSYHPAFDPSALKGPRSGVQNEVLVLGTPHLAYLPPTFEIAKLTLVTAQLMAWRPQAIAVEMLSGPQCDFLHRYPHRYKGTIRTYCWDPAPAQAATGFDVAAATVRAEQMLAAWPSGPAPTDRRRLTALFLAAGEPASAVVQWLRLPEAERRAGDGLDAVLVERLREFENKRDERYSVAAQLAARLGHERVYPMDDHTADPMITDEIAYIAAITQAWNNPASDERRRLEKSLNEQLATPADVLALYKAHNVKGTGGKGRILPSQRGGLHTVPADGRHARAPGASWWAADGAARHRSGAPRGATFFIEG